jgi:phosphoribosylformimino-5-aminoimidazole carboxamide ribotide isomerase
VIVYPAIDLKEGQCVRLTRGDMASAEVFNPDPAAQARAFAAAGFQWIHVVDLDGAMAGRSVNAPAVAQIAQATSLSVQLGGGIRSMADVERWLCSGVTRVIIGTAAVRDPEMARAACARFPGRVAIGVDARRGMVSLQCWTEDSGLRAEVLAARAAQWGAAAIVHTDIDQDGTGGGLNVEATAALARAVDIPVIASGGVGGSDDIRAAAAVGVIGGVVVGKALYTGALSPAEALAAAGP